MRETDTPRTDAKEAACDSLCDQAWGNEGWDFARQLERELSRAVKLAEDNGKLAHQAACELTEARKQRDTLAEALEHIAEYWNQNNNATAMEDACWHAIQTAESALAAVKGGES